MSLHGVEPARMERVASQQAERSPGDSPENTVPLDRVACVPGAGRLKSAGRRKKRRDPSLIDHNQTEAELSHRPSDSEINNPSCLKADVQASRSLGWRARSASRLGNTTRAQPPTSCARTCLASSRNMRLARFRVTAPPRRLPTTMPIRVCPVPEAQESRLNSGV